MLDPLKVAAHTVFNTDRYDISIFDPDAVYGKAMEALAENDDLSGMDPMTNYGINEKGTPMRIGILRDSHIDFAQLKPATSSIMFKTGNIPTSDSLFSYEIFGSTSDERRKNCAYIDLKKPFIHPYIYEAARNVVRAIDKIAAGRGRWRMIAGVPTEIGDEDEFVEGDGTGLRWLINNFRKIDFAKNQSYIHNEYVDLINNSSDEEIFITKWVVIPVFYRDANFTGKKMDIPEINEFYKKLIQLVNALQSSVMSDFMNNTELTIQSTLVAIRKYGQNLVDGKSGFLKQFVIGKTTVYGARNVITQPTYTNVKKPSELMVDIFHAGFPIATCCSLGYPFIERWITEFMGREFETRERKQVLVKHEDGSYTMEYAKIGDVMAMYNPSYLEKKVEQFMETYGSRFEPLTIPMADGSESYILFTGRPYSKDPQNEDAPPTAQRPMTWTDLLYMAAVNTMEFGGKMAYVTRYPMLDYFGTFPIMMRVSSTIALEPMTISGTYYPFYPKIEIDAPQNEVSTMFYDVLMIDNVYLEGLGGDYDGDMVSEKMCFTDEANDEAYQIMTNVKNFVSIGGDFNRAMGHEATLTFFAMTRD